MASSPSQGVLFLLGAAGIGASAATTGWRLGIGKLLDQPNTQVVAYDVPGQNPDPAWLLDYPVVQVMVRGGEDGYRDAFQKIRDVYDVLLGIDPQTVNGDRWDGITVLSTPSHIGYDDKNRPLFSANFRIILEPAPSALTHRQPL